MNPIVELKALLADERVLDAPADLVHYGRDTTRWWPARPLAIALPESTQEVQALVAWAIAHKVALVPSGGRTGLSGGAVAASGELVVSFERMRRIIDFNRLDRTVTVEAGVVTEAVQNIARENGLFYPVDFASRGSSQIGGNVATNAGGVRVIRYGMTRDWVVGLKVVDGRGNLLDLNRGLVKNATGYDFRHLMIGSEGTLGLVVETTLRLTDSPHDPRVLLLGMDRVAHAMAALDLMRQRLRISAFELFTRKALDFALRIGHKKPPGIAAPYYVLAECDAARPDEETGAVAVFEELSERGWVTDGIIAQSADQAAELWRYREDIADGITACTPYEYENDISVRVSQIPAFVADMDALFAREYPEWETVWFGHAGDGNLHVSVLKPEALDNDTFVGACERVTERLCDLLATYGGSISAEHGIGRLKKPYLSRARSPLEVELMRGLKQVFDPHGILNPGKLID